MRAARLRFESAKQHLVTTERNRTSCTQRVTDRTNSTQAHVDIRIGAIDDPGMAELLAFAVTKTAALSKKSFGPTVTAPDRRRTGVGSQHLGALHHGGSRLPIVAETDSDAAGFYAANHFTITSLGEKYPGVERFRVCLAASATATALNVDHSRLRRMAPSHSLTQIRNGTPKVSA